MRYKETVQNIWQLPVGLSPKEKAPYVLFLPLDSSDTTHKPLLLHLRCSFHENAWNLGWGGSFLNNPYGALFSRSYRAQNSSGLHLINTSVKKMSIIILRIPGRLGKGMLRLLCACRRWWNVRWSFRDRLKLHLCVSICLHFLIQEAPGLQEILLRYRQILCHLRAPGKPFISISSMTMSKWIFINILFIWLHQVLAVARGSLLPDPGFSQ